MFGGIYENIVSITADHTLLSTEDLGIIPSTVAAVKTITLALARQKDAVFLNNQSSYPHVIAVQSGDTLNARGLILPGQRVRYDSDNFSNWYKFSPPNIFQVADISISSAQILAMHTTPIALVPAPGAGRVLIPQSLDLQIVRTSTQYANGGVLELRYTDGSGALMIATIAASFVTGAAGTVYASVNAVVTAATPVANAPLVLTANGADFTLGTGVMKAKLAYRISDFN